MLNVDKNLSVDQAEEMRQIDIDFKVSGIAEDVRYYLVGRNGREVDLDSAGIAIVLIYTFIRYDAFLARQTLNNHEPIPFAIAQVVADKIKARPHGYRGFGSDPETLEITTRVEVIMDAMDSVAHHSNR